MTSFTWYQSENLPYNLVLKRKNAKAFLQRRTGQLCWQLQCCAPAIRRRLISDEAKTPTWNI